MHNPHTPKRPDGFAKYPRASPPRCAPQPAAVAAGQTPCAAAQSDLYRPGPERCFAYRRRVEGQCGRRCLRWAFKLLLKLQLHLRINAQRSRQLIQIIALCVLLIIHQHHTGQVHLGRYRRVMCEFGKIRSIQGLGDFGVEPLPQLRVVGVLPSSVEIICCSASSIRPSAFAAAIKARNTRMAVGLGFEGHPAGPLSERTTAVWRPADSAMPDTP